MQNLIVRQINNWSDDTKKQLSPQLLEAFDIRRVVFIIGQDVPEEDDFDGLDESSNHVVAYLKENDKEKAVGTARFRVVSEEPLKVKLERFAVLEQYRGQGVGRQMVRAVLDFIQKDEKLSQVTTIYLHAQLAAVSLYEREGFEKEGDKFDESGIMHYKMIWRK